MNNQPEISDHEERPREQSHPRSKKKSKKKKSSSDKIESKKLADKAGVSTVPGYMGVIETADRAVSRTCQGECPEGGLPGRRGFDQS